MKLVVILLTASFLRVQAQNTHETVTYTGNKVKLEAVLAEIRKQTGYMFFYSGKDLEQSNPVTIKLKQTPVEEALKQVMSNQPFTYLIKSNTVFIKAKTAATAQAPIEAVNPTTQLSIVRGRITNEEGESVIATVTVKGTTKGIVSGERGEFILVGIDQDALLTLSAINIVTQEVPVRGRSDLGVIVVKKRIENNSEVVVTTGYQTLSKEKVTGSFVKIEKEQINRTIGTNIINRLEGITPGLYFDNRRPGKATTLQLRGKYTLLSESQPLIVVDNFPYEGDINAINPNDVEDITLLTDAAAASIWGARAGNGVIVINTKKGKLNQPVQVSVNSSINITEKPDLFSLPIISSSDAVDIEGFLFDRNAYNSDINSPAHTGLAPGVEIRLKQKNGQLTMEEANRQLDLLREQDVRNDILKHMYRNDVLQSHAFSMSMGSRVSTTYLSMGYDKRLQSQVGNNYDRISIRVSNGFQPLPKLNIQTGINYMHQRTGYNGTSFDQLPVGSRQVPLYSRFTDEEGNPLVIDRYFRGAYLDTFQNGKLLDWKYRPLDEIRNRDYSITQQTLLASFGAKYQVLNSLNAEVTYQYERLQSLTREHNNIETYYARDLINRYTNPSATTLTARYPIPLGGIMDLQQTTMNTHNVRGQLNYNQKWSSHQVTALAGAEIRQRQEERMQSRLYGYDELGAASTIDYITRFPLITGGSAVIPTNVIRPFQRLLNRFVSTFANASYTYRDRYIVYASARKDAANIFGVTTNQKGRPFWSVGSSWKISGESFYRFKWMPLLKLRMTYGYSGNIDPSISGYTIISLVPASANTVTNLPQANIAQVPNTKLRWEKTGQYNVGLDLALKGNWLAATLEYYEKRSTDVISFQSLDPTTGRQSLNANSADMKGNGIDIRINIKMIETRAFQWNSAINLSSAKYKILKQKGSDQMFTTIGTDGLAQKIIAGQNPYVVYSLPWGGLDPANGNPMGMLDGKVYRTYDSIKYTQVSDLIIHGPNIPVYMGNWLNQVMYKNWSLSANITYKFGHYFRRPTVNYGQLFSGSGLVHEDYNKRWMKPGDEQFTSVPSMIYPNPSSRRDAVYLNSSALVEKGDHLRWNDIRLGYTLLGGNSHKWPFKSVHLFALASNLNVLLWKATDVDIDPDYSQGIRVTPPKSFAAGLNVNF